MTDASVIIPSRKGTVRTVGSVPSGVPTHVVSEGNRAEARNIGAREAEGDVLVFCDDDIAFDQETFWRFVDACLPGRIRGLEDFDFGLLLTRFMVVHRVDWETVGEFDAALNHMEDTEWCLRARQAGLTLESLPRETVDHQAHDNEIGTRERGRAFAQVARRHPQSAPGLVADMLSSSA